MPETMTFTSTTSRFSLPMLHSGQSQKEVFVNESLSLIDTLMHCTVEGEALSPPENSVDGQTWLVGTGGTGEWQGHDQQIAVRRGGAWIFMAPRNGMRLFDLAAGREMLFFRSWRKGSLPVEPLGGLSVDGEARAAINDLVSALQALGILPSA